MDHSSIDLRDTRGRLARLAIAATIAAAVTILVMRWIASVSPRPNTDPVGGSTVGLLAIAMFVMTTVAASGALGVIARRR